jgi:toxin YhaV
VSEPVIAHGWTLLFHACIAKQISRLQRAIHRVEKDGPAPHNSNVKLFHAVSTLIFDNIPTEPDHARFRIGNTLGKKYSNWRRAKIGRRFRLFFRYDSATKIIIYAWLMMRIPSVPLEITLSLMWSSATCWKEETLHMDGWNCYQQ